MHAAGGQPNTLNIMHAAMYAIDYNLLNAVRSIVDFTYNKTYTARSTIDFI